MTSLSEAYDGRGGGERSLRRLYLGVGLFVGGVLLVVAGILTAGTSLVTLLGYSLGEARLWGGVLGGIGVPAVMLGVFTVLPSGRTTKAAALVGVGLSLFGVALFYHAYPYHWIGGPRPELADLTLPTAGLYFLGIATTLWCLFVGVANFKTRNDPGGTVEMEVTHKGETKIIEVERDRLSGLGGIGFLGNTPDGDVETQTNASPTAAASSDGGSTTETLSSPLDDDSPPTPTTKTDGPGSRSRDGTADSRGHAGRSGSRTARKSESRPGGSSESRTAGSTARQPTDAGTGSTPGPTGGTGASESGHNSGPGPGSPTGSDTGGATSGRSAPGVDESGTDSREKGTAADHYCGSCTHFQYVRTEEGMQPYCGLDDEPMDSMDACDEWTPR